MAKKFLEGYCMYARVFEHNRDLEGYEGAYKEHDGMYEIAVGFPDGGPEFRQMMSWNTKFEPKRLGDNAGFTEEKGAKAGLAYFRFKRKHIFEIQKGDNKGKIVDEWGGAPDVKLIRDGKILPFPEGELIGNGSKVTVKLDVKEAGRRTYIRFEGLAVHDNEWVKVENPDAGYIGGAAPPLNAKPVEEPKAEQAAPAPEKAKAGRKAKFGDAGTVDYDDDVPF